MIWFHGRNSRSTVPMIGVRPMPPPTCTRKPSSPASFFTSLQADVVPAGGGAVFGGAGDRDLELARQEGELGMQRAPLPHDLGEGARVGDLVDRDAGALVAGDVADAVAAGLDAVHVDRGQQVHHVGRLGERNPVVLDVLARGEVARSAWAASACRACPGFRAPSCRPRLPARRTRARSSPARAAARWRARRRARPRAASARSAAHTSRFAAAAGGTRPRRSCRSASARAGRGIARRAGARTGGRNLCIGTSCGLGFGESACVHGPLKASRECKSAPYGNKLFFGSRLMRISLFASLHAGCESDEHAYSG